MGAREGRAIEEMLGVRQASNLGTYHGMSSKSSRSSKIKDKVEKILQGWKERIFQ